MDYKKYVEDERNIIADIWRFNHNYDFNFEVSEYMKALKDAVNESGDEEMKRFVNAEFEAKFHEKLKVLDDAGLIKQMDAEIVITPKGNKYCRERLNLYCASESDIKQSFQASTFSNSMFVWSERNQNVSEILQSELQQRPIEYTILDCKKYDTIEKVQELNDVLEMFKQNEDKHVVILENFSSASSMYNEGKDIREGIINSVYFREYKKSTDGIYAAPLTFKNARFIAMLYRDDVLDNQVNADYCNIIFKRASVYGYPMLRFIII